MLAELAKIKVLVFVNLKCMLDIQDFKQLCKCIEYNDMNVLFVETQKNKKFVDGEINIVIDEDKCEFVSRF